MARNAMPSSCATPRFARSPDGTLAERLAQDAHDVALLHDQEFFAIELDLGTRPLAEQHLGASLDVHGGELAGLVPSAGTHRHDLTLRWFFLHGIGNDD